MNLSKNESFKFSPPENPYDNRTLEGGSKPPRLSPEGMEAYFGNLLGATTDKSDKGSSKNQVNLNIKRAESAAENNPSTQYRDYDRWNEGAPIPKNSSPEENFASNQPKVYRPSRDEVKHSPQPAKRNLKQHLHDKNISLQSGEVLKPSSVEATVVPSTGDSDQTNPSRPASLAVPPFPEDSYVPLERLPSKPQHKVPRGKEETQRTNGMTSPQEEVKGVPVGQTVNNSINMKQGKHKAKLGQVPALSERNNPSTDGPTNRKTSPVHINNPLSETSDYIDSEPPDSPPSLPKYIHVDPRKGYNTTEKVPADDYQHYLEPATLLEFDTKLRKTPIKTWDYSSDSSKGNYLSDSDDSLDMDCLKPPGLGQPTPQKRNLGGIGKPPLPVRKAPPLPVRKKETARFSDANGPETRHTEIMMGQYYEQRIGGQHQVKGQIRGKKLPNTTGKPDKKEKKRRKSEGVIRKVPDETAKQRQAARPTSDLRDNRIYNTSYYSQSLPRPTGKNRPTHKRESSLDASVHLSDKLDEDGFRGVGSPSGRTGRDRRKQQQKMLSSGGNMVKMPRQPRPKRMKIILEYLSKGVVNCIELNKQKLEHMKQQLMEGHAQGRTSQGLQYNLEKHMKTTERHLRKLEFHLAKVEELQEQYEKELKVRDGGENILRAFSEANSSKAKGSMSEAKQRVKDCTQNMCHLEAELEVNLGVFIMKIEGIAGFARVCRGDVFEISFKYGFQKWKSKCKVEKDLSQTWENAEVMFYPMLADYLQIKVTEIRGIARSNIIIGSLEFDTSDFYQAEPQNLTIDVNEAGTIKLNVVISWSPFQIVEDELKILNKNSYSRRERSQTESSLPNYRPQSTVVPPPLTSKPEVRPTSASVPVSVSVDLDDVPMLTLAESLHNVNKLLEILHGQYVELKTLEKQVNSLESHLKKKSNIDTQGSMSSLSIKNALDSFSFLDEVDEGLSDGEEDLTEQTNTQNLAEKSTSVPKSKSLDHLQFAASKTDKDSHISASRPDLRATQRQERPSAKRSSRFLDLSEKRESRMVEVNEQRSSGLLDSPTVDSSFGSLGRSSMDPEPEPLTTGSESIDMVLVQHLMYTEYQLSHLGAFGPLKLKESIALDKLQKQAVIIEQLVMLSSSGEELFRADDILPELKLNPALLEFWEQCSEKHALYVNADLFLLQLDVKFGVKLRTNHPDIADDVFQSLGHRIIERPIDLLDPKAIITLFQYITFFAQEDRKNPERFINDLTNEFELTASLEPGNADLPKIVKKLPKEVLLPTGNLRALGLLLLEESDTIKNGVRSYLESICNNPKARQKAIHVYAECLEERDLSLRQAGCVALAAMRAREKLEQLVYLLQCDMDDVKQTVKEALMTFGEEGRQAYESLSIQPYAYSQQQHRNDGPLLTTEL